jgi:GNAT superfamily N-acetyltransferase
MDAISLAGLSAGELTAAANANLATHFGWVQARAPGMLVRDIDDLLLVDSGLPCDTFNLVSRARLTPASAPERIREAIGHFTAAGRPFSWWVNPGDEPSDLGALLTEAGLQAAETELAMAADLSRLQRVGDLSPGGLEIQRVRTKRQLEDFARVVAANWTPPDENVLRFYELAAPLLLGDDAALWLYIGYLDGVPVATSELTVGGGVAGLYNICTLEGYRRRGFATALTLRPLLDARKAGYRAAILQASDDGAKVYARIGFEPFGQITEYKPVG